MRGTTTSAGTSHAVAPAGIITAVAGVSPAFWALVAGGLVLLVTRAGRRRTTL